MKRLHRVTDYKSPYGPIENIPEQYQFSSLESEYRDGHFWNQFFNQWFPEGQYSDSYISCVQRVGNMWEEYSAIHDCHPAFTSPELVVDWCKEISSDISPVSIYGEYLSILLMFYRYLVWNIECPHIYNPVAYAIQDNEYLKEVWQEGVNYHD